MDGTSETAELATVKNDANDLDARESGCLEENVTAIGLLAYWGYWPGK